jgi:integral membrane sensor domain MASE1
MYVYFGLLATVPVLMICYQMYAFSVNKQGAEKQKSCQMLGIVYMTSGITALIARQPVFVFMGLVLMMVGFRLMATGLDRIDKKIYIDHYDEDDLTEKENR